MSEKIVPKTVPREIVSTEWFQGILTEIKATIIESAFASKWIVIEGKWKIGDLLLKAKKKFKEVGVKEETLPSFLSEILEKMNIRISEREIYRCMRFRKVYPDLKELPGGKEISWHKISNRLLPGRAVDCSHPAFNEITSYKCKVCGQIFRKLPETVSRTDIRARIDGLIVEFLEKTGLPELGESRAWGRKYAKLLLQKYPKEKISGAIDYYMEDKFWQKNLDKISRLFRLMPKFIREGEVSEEEI